LKSKSDIQVSYDKFTNSENELMTKAIAILMINQGLSQQQVEDYFDVVKSKD